MRPQLYAAERSLQRLNDHIVRVFLGAFAGYDILAAESIYVTVPASAVASQQPLVALPAVGSVAEGLGCIPITPAPGRVVLSGSCDGVREEDLRSLGECEVRVELIDEAWVRCTPLDPCRCPLACHTHTLRVRRLVALTPLAPASHPPRTPLAPPLASPTTTPPLRYLVSSHCLRATRSCRGCVPWHRSPPGGTRRVRGCSRPRISS